MGRRERRDADYFPFYAKEGRTLFVLESNYGCKGTGFFTNVLRFLTRQTDHHYCIANDSDRLYFFAKTYCDEETGMDMLQKMANTGKIDRDLWENLSVIVSQDLLSSLEDAYRRRSNNIITMDDIRQIYSAENDLTPEDWTPTHKEWALTPEEKERRQSARQVLKSAIRRGEIKILPCEVCGAKEVEGHHKDYDKPLKVVWLCKKHHPKLS